MDGATTRMRVRWGFVALVVLFALVILLVGAASPAGAAVLVPDEEAMGVLSSAEARHVFWAPEGATIELRLEAEDFDPYLILLDGDGRPVAQGGISGASSLARLTYASGRGGWHTAVVTSPGGAGRGAYTLSLRLETAAGSLGTEGIQEPSTGPEGAAAPSLPWGEWVAGELSGSEAVYFFRADAGDVVSLRMTSDKIDAHLALFDPSGNELAVNDDADPKMNAQILARIPESGRYRVVASDVDRRVSGSYRLFLEKLSELAVFSDALESGDADVSGRIVHEYLWPLVPGAHLSAWLVADFDAYLEVVAEDGTPLSSDDDSGGWLNARLSYGPVEGGSVYVRVTSPSGEEAGDYTLYLWAHGPSGPDEPGSAALPALYGPGSETAPAGEERSLAPGEIAEGALQAGQYQRYVLPAGEGWDGYDVWLFSESDVDLYVWPRAGGVDYEDVMDVSESSDGYEHVRIPPSPLAEEVVVEVSMYDLLDASGHYFLFAEPIRPGAETPVPEYRPQDGPQTGLEPARTPYAGALEPGRRSSGRIEAGKYSTQFWTVHVPEGVERLSVGLFRAEGDFDLSLSPGWEPSLWGETHAHRSTSMRENERLVVDGADAPLSPGVYTVAVWAAHGVSAGYEIEVSFDEPLPPSATYEPIPQSELDAMSPTRRAQVGTVHIENESGSGSGTILTPDGLILTNYHVVAACEPLPSVPAGCAGPAGGAPPEGPSEQIIGITDARRGYAVQHFVAVPVATLPEYDLALLEIVADLEGNPVRDLRLPALRLDASEDAVALGDEVLVLGYPVIAQLGARVPLTLTRGIVSGFTEWEGKRIFLQTDAAIAGGNSGGALVRLDDGVLVGVPSDRTYEEESVESQNFARPVALLPAAWLDLIEARGGEVLGR